MAKLVDPPRVPRPEVHPLTPGAAILLAAARGHRFEHLYAFLLGTGVRLGEVLALRWEDIDQDTNRVTVRRTLERLPGKPWRLVEPKSASGRRTVPLIGPTQAALLAQRRRVLEMQMLVRPAWQDLGLVFPSAIGTPLDGRNVYHEFKKLLVRAGLPTTHRVHDLRHSTATYLLAAGVPDRIVMEIMGHSQLSMTIRYQHILPAMLDDAATRLAAVFPTSAGAA